MNTTAADTSANKNTKGFHTAGRRDAVKNEVIDGRVVARSTSGRSHNLIVANFVIAIGGRMQRGTNELYPGDMQVAIGKNAICYPDVVVVSGEPVFADNNQDILKNPTVVIEVVSNASRSAGATQKLEWFLALPQIRECLLVNEDEMRVEHYARQNPKQWIYRIYNERDDVMSLDSINCKLSLAEVYAQVKLRESELSSKAVN